MTRGHTTDSKYGLMTGNATHFRVLPKLIHSRSLVTPTIAEGFDRNVKTDLVPILETICDRFGGIVDLDRNALD